VVPVKPQVVCVGFDELIVVLLVLGILAAIAVPTYDTLKTNSATKTFQANVEAIARNANAIGASGNVDGLPTAGNITAAAGETEYTEASGVISGTVGSYSCTATITLDATTGLAEVSTAASCS
jgi:Tfp pilus assembly protein PilE